jgi:hypothetical protein
MAQWVLKDTMKIVPRRTLRCLTDLEKRTQSVINEQNAFMDKCKQRYGDKLTVSSAPFETNGPDDDDSGEFVPYEDDTTPPVEMPVTEATDATGKLLIWITVWIIMSTWKSVFLLGRRVSCLAK